ncbi:MAG: hypothetical protein K5669_12845 [Lachnospiraceae bacterium]|nr:hypothetical protein [Lachnospiraceae bacterium]
MDISGVMTDKTGYFAYGNSTVLEAHKKQSEAVSEFHKETGAFLRSEPELDCPYNYLAKDGVIEYNGVIFVCDYRHNAINLGDVSDPKKVLRIGLPSGGSLNVNINNLDSISFAAGMFSSEDLNAIMRAIHEYNHCKRKLEEIEEDESKTVEENAKGSSAGSDNDGADEDKVAEYEENSLITQINSYRTEMYYKLIHGETEERFKIGGQEMTLKEWDKMLERFDESQEYVREDVKEDAQDRDEDAAREEIVRKLFEDRG